MVKMMGRRLTLLIINCLILILGACGGPLIMRLYFIHGGGSVWFSSWLETAGFPVLIIPLVFQYLARRSQEARPRLFLMNVRVLIGSLVIGILTGVDDYLYAYGMAKLPVSTSSLVTATQLGFVAVFAFFIVRQKFTAYSINAVVLLMIGAGVLAINSSGDRPAGESKSGYIVGFIMTLGASILYALVLVLVELVYHMAKQEISYTLVIEFQLVMGFVSTVFCTFGLIPNHGFQQLSSERANYTLGSGIYYLVVVMNAVLWQFFFLGVVGVINYSSSLLSGIIITLALPLNEVLGVVFYGEKFSASKGVSLILALWGFVSYFYGEYKKSRKAKNAARKEEEAQVHGVELPPQQPALNA